MLVVCNGIYKSGSTWIYMIAKELLTASEINSSWSECYNKENIRLTSSFLAEADLDKNNYIVKSHCYNECFLKRIMKGRPTVVIYSDRDDFGLIVSHYHHFSKEKINLPFSVYLPIFGFFKLIENHAFRTVINNNQLYSLKIDFEQLKSRTEEVVQDISQVLGANISDTEIQDIVRKTNLKNKKNNENRTGMKGRDWFFTRNEYIPSKFTKLSFKIINFMARGVVSNEWSLKLVLRFFQSLPNRKEFRDYESNYKEVE